MTNWYIENRIADFTNRIITAERLKDLHESRGQLLEAKHMQRTIDDLTKSLSEFKAMLVPANTEEIEDDDSQELQVL